jgi:hypothetical protein
LIRLRINGALYCHDVLNLKRIIQETPAGRRPLEPMTRVPFSEFQLARIRDHPAELSSDVASERARGDADRRRFSQEEYDAWRRSERVGVPVRVPAPAPAGYRVKQVTRLRPGSLMLPSRVFRPVVLPRYTGSDIYHDLIRSLSVYQRDHLMSLIENELETPPQGHVPVASRRYRSYDDDA